MNKLLVAYGIRPPLSEDRIQHMAKFNMIVTGTEMAEDVSRIKMLNPNCKIIGYKNVMGVHPTALDYPEITIHEDWFLHDLNGNRLVHRSYGWEALDVGNKGWQNYYANYIKEKCDQYGFNGVFADDVWEWQVPWHNTVWTVDASIIPPEIASTHKTRMVDFIKTVKSLLGSRLMILNTNVLWREYIESADGLLIENFMKTAYAEQHLQGYLQTGNKIVLCWSRIPTDLTFSLASYLIGETPKTYWGYTSSTYFPNDPNWSYPPEMDLDIGNPRGAYYQVESKLYSRDFDHAKVFVNFSGTETYTVTIDEEPYMLPPHSGVIAPWEAPPIGGPLTAILASVLFTASLIASVVRDGSRVSK